MNDLIHYGILGMRWGKRKSGGSDSSDHATASVLKKKRLNEMSNEELKKLTARLQLEKQYKDLTKKEVGAGRKFVGEVMTGVAKQATSKFLADNLPKIASFVGNQVQNALIKPEEWVK